MLLLQGAADFRGHQLSMHSACICCTWSQAVEGFIDPPLVLVALPGSKCSQWKVRDKSCVFGLWKPSVK